MGAGYGVLVSLRMEEKGEGMETVTNQVSVVALRALDDDDTVFVTVATKLVTAPVTACCSSIVGRVGRGGGGGSASKDDSQPPVDDFADWSPLGCIDWDLLWC